MQVAHWPEDGQPANSRRWTKDDPRADELA